MTGICAVGEWIERPRFPRAVGLTETSLRDPSEPGIELGLRLAATDGWRIGVPTPTAVVSPALAVDRFDEDPERWDGLS